MKLEPNCKLCKLIKTDQRLFSEVHQMVFVQKIPKRKVMEWLNKQIEILNASLEPKDQINPFNSTNFHYHFKDHIKDKRVFTEIILDEERKIVASEVFSPAEAIIASSMQDSLKSKDDYNDYIDMNEMTDTFEKVLKLQCYSSLNDKRDLTIMELRQLQDLLVNHFKVKKDLSTIRKSDSVAGEAIERLSKDIVKSLIGKLKEISKELSKMVEDQTGSPKFAKDIQNMMFEQIKKHIQAEVTDIVKTIKRVYKIK